MGTETLTGGMFASPILVPCGQTASGSKPRSANPQHERNTSSGETPGEFQREGGLRSSRAGPRQAPGTSTPGIPSVSTQVTHTRPFHADAIEQLPHDFDDQVGVETNSSASRGI